MKKHGLLFCTIIWLAASTVGLSVLFVYENTPGSDTVVHRTWPRGSKVPLLSPQPTLIVFAHPKCPCTRATIGELAILMAHCQNKVNAYVVFFRPNGVGKDWANTDLWRSAQAIPGVAVLSDEAGKQARLFQVTTSGHALLYSAKGILLFSGGITESRGHSGDNEGRSDIMQLLDHELLPGQKTPSFGCSLFPKHQG